MPRCCIVTAYRNSEYAALAQLTLPRMQAFAARHGHELRVHRMEDTHLDRAWMKVPPILDALQGDFEFVVWLDIDALILRLDRDILDEAQPGIDLLVSWHGPDTAQPEGPTITPHYNAGIYLIRRSDWSKDFFARMLALHGQVKHTWSDQAALHLMLGLNESLGFGPDLADVADRAYVGRLDPAWNSIPGVAVSDDPVIHHFAGLPHATRLKLLRSNVAILEFYDSAPAPLRSALSHQINLWAATACEMHTLAEEARRLRAPRQMLRRFPGAVARRLREKVRGN
jgi:hypothetical protein